MKVVKKYASLAFLVFLAGCGGGSAGGGYGGATGSSFVADGAPSTDGTNGGSATTLAGANSTGGKEVAVEKLDASWVSVASEGFNFTVPAGTVVQYGAGSSYTSKTVSGSGVCTSGFFGGDPSPNVVKACFVQSGSSSTPAPAPAPAAGAATPSTGTRLAGEGEAYRLSAPTTVRFGAGSGWVEKTLSDVFFCNASTFGSDPAPNVYKACYSGGSAATAPPAAVATGTRLSGEGQNFTVATATTVRYGAGSSWVEKTVTGSGACTNAFFGSDPASGVVKACYAGAAPAITAPPVVVVDARLAGEGEAFTVSSPTTVRFGAGASWIEKYITGFSFCTNSAFGGDPAPGNYKACYSVAGGGTATPTPPAPVEPAPPPPTATGPVQANDIVDASLNVVASSLRSTAPNLSKDAGIEYRYGPSAAAYGVGDGGLPMLYKRPDLLLGSPAPNHRFTWQVGGPPSSNAGAYSTNQANTIFVADNPSAVFGGLGVTDFQVTGYMYNTFAQSPQLSWTITLVPGAGLDSENVMSYKAAGEVAGGSPIAVARCAGRPGFCSQSVVVFQNGLIGTAGSNTAGNNASVKLPANKVPTGIAMTNNSEFALVTVWDTTTAKGQVAVVALAGLCDGCDPNNANGGPNNYPKAWYDWWHEWKGVYPGLPNMGDIAFMKILGYVDLPGMNAPTDIAVTTGLDQFDTMQAGGQYMGYDHSPLTSHWQSFTAGQPNYRRYAKGGVAVVTSKSEQKVAFVDLKPLFSYINGVYFSSNVGSTSNFGQAADQWPYAFSKEPSQTPTVVKTIALGAKPTAVKTTVLSSNPRAWVATQDGTLRIFSLDGYAPGGAVQSPSPSAIAQVGTVNGIGRNPTSLANSKGEPGANFETLNQQVIVASRGDRKISWVRFATNGNTGSIVRTLQDQRLKDPIAVEDADNFANAGFVLSVADYADKSIKNFRYGPVVFSDGGSCPRPNGCPVTPTNGIQIEYAGALALPGKPFQIMTANVP